MYGGSFSTFESVDELEYATDEELGDAVRAAMGQRIQLDI